MPAMSALQPNRNPRRDEIIDAARRLMRDAGDAGFSMRNLATEAGVSIATPYNLFGSKQAILLAVLDADLSDYQRELAAMQADAIEVLFDASALLSTVLRREPDFYRNALAAVARDGPEFGVMVNAPRYLVWKRLLQQATAAGLLSDAVNPDAFAIASSQLMMASLLEWAGGTLTLEELDARNEYGLALTLSAIATDRSRDYLAERMRRAENRLQRLWRAALMNRLERGELDDETRALLAGQLKLLQKQAATEQAATEKEEPTV